MPELVAILTNVAPDLVKFLFGNRAHISRLAVVHGIAAVTGIDPTTPANCARVLTIIATEPGQAKRLTDDLAILAGQLQAEADLEIRQRLVALAIAVHRGRAGPYSIGAGLCAAVLFTVAITASLFIYSPVPRCGIASPAGFTPDPGRAAPGSTRPIRVAQPAPAPE